MFRPHVYPRVSPGTRLAAKRADNIAKREASRSSAAPVKKQGSKYSKTDVQNLKKVFDSYDKDGSGKISLQEFKDELAVNKKKHACSGFNPFWHRLTERAANPVVRSIFARRRGPQAGTKSTLAERKADEGTSILELSEGVFDVMDKVSAPPVTRFGLTPDSPGHAHMQDGDGEVRFEELLAMMYNLATATEMETMMSWVAAP